LLWKQFLYSVLVSHYYSKVKSKGEKFFLKSFTISVSEALSVTQAYKKT